MELMDPKCKRIKLEHSYAVTCDTHLIKWPKIEEEDPLKIYPEDFLKVENEDDVVVNHYDDVVINHEDDVVIKQEDNVVNNHEDDVVIKQEEVPDVDANQSVAHMNFSVVSQQFENHSHSNSSILLSDEESNNCNNETERLELEDKCAIANKINRSVPVNPKFLAIVPRRFCLKLQENYEKRISSLKSQNERLTLANLLRNENAERISPQGPGIDPPVYNKMFDKYEDEIRQLQEKLADSKTRENMLETKARLGEEELKLLRERRDADTKAKEAYVDEINNLKGRLNYTQAQLVCIRQLRNVVDMVKKDSPELNDLRAECARLKSALDMKKKDNPTLRNLKTECAKLKSELEKSQKERLAVDKELVDSNRIREILTERSIRLNNRLLLESKNNSYQLQEAQKDLTRSMQFAKKLQKSLDVEKKKNSYLEKEKELLLKEQECKYKQMRKELQQLIDIERNKNSYLVKEREQLLEEQECKYKQVCKELHLATQKSIACKAMLSNRILETSKLRGDLRKLAEQFNLKVLECKKKDEEYKSRVCEYCGFE